MRNIGFGAGYHEWVVLVDDELYYSFEDLGDWFSGIGGEEPIKTKDELICLIDTLILDMQDFIADEEKFEQLTDNETEYLRNMMIVKLENYYLD